jgi:putative FmdB family regulatory protein
MPSYDYQCKECGHTFEELQSMSDAPLSTCPECRTESLHRLIGGGLGVIFKGSGYYVTDSKKSGSSKETA